MGESQTLFTKSNTIFILYSSYKHWLLNNNNNNNNIDAIGLMLQAT
jgi:hypothetical protein